MTSNAVGALHRWDVNPAEALAIQRELRPVIELSKNTKPIQNICGLDVEYTEQGRAVAAAAVLDAESLDVIDEATVSTTTTFPYLPGLFSFREIPPLLAVLEKLETVPDLVVCDGHGSAHPERFGLASHLGLWLDLPTIGCAKKRLIGTFEEPGLKRGDWSVLSDGEEQVGHVLRTQTNIKPVYVSPGHLISFEQAIEWIIRLTPKYRVPETTRQADQLAARAKYDGG